jgi:uncharacterized membrane protein
MRIFIAILSLTLVAACNMSSPPGNKIPARLDSVNIFRDSVVIKAFRGLYSRRGASFRICDTTTTMIIKNHEKLDSVYDKILPNAYPGQAIVADIIAKFDPANPGTLVLTGINSTEQQNYRNNCLFSEFWISGTEPFWTLQVSKKGNLIDFYDPMTQSTTHFTHVEPKIKAGLTYYDATNGKDTIAVRIKEEKCNGATDSQYDYSAEVTLNGKLYHGCGNSYYKITVSNAIK